MSSDGDTIADVLVLGASFAGLEVVHQLLRLSERAPPKIVVVDRQAAHGYLPLVQERIVGSLEARASALATGDYVRSIQGARFVEAEVEAFDPETKTVTLGDGSSISARFVVIALGSTASPPAAIAGSEHLLGYKLGPEFEAARATLERVLAERPDAPLAVIGGGISGCELAAELARFTQSRPESRNARVTLVSAGDRILPGFAARVAGKAKRALEAQGIELRLGARVVAAHPDGLQLRESGAAGTEQVELECAAAFWAGGVRPAEALARLGVPLDPGGWLRVGPTLQCFASPRPTHPDIFGCGDAARVWGGDGEWPTMQRAIECLWQAKLVAKNIARLQAEPPDYPDGVPPLIPHKLRETFFFGLSLGARSFVVYRWLMLDIPGLNHGFRRWLMRRYFARYEAMPGGPRGET